MSAFNARRISIRVSSGFASRLSLRALYPFTWLYTRARSSTALLWLCLTMESSGTSTLTCSGLVRLLNISVTFVIESSKNLARLKETSYRKQQELKYFVCRKSTVLGNIGFAEQFSKHLVYHKISTSFWYDLDCGDFIIPKIGCCFYVKAIISCIILPEKSSRYASFAGGKVK